MDMPFEKFREKGKDLFRKGFVREVLFSGPTYQIEVYDPEEQETYWPFLQFDEDLILKDAFCSCFSDEEGCSHLAGAYLKIFNGSDLPFHIRFRDSFWNHLCQIFAHHTGYETRLLEKKKAGGVYRFENDVFFQIETKTAESKKQLAEWIESTRKETPETSLKFSNISQDEILRWKEGRPSPSLRYALSFWSDLAKWMMSFEENAEVLFKEDTQGFPTHIETLFPSYTITWKMGVKDLEGLISSIETVEASLKIFHPVDEKLIGASYDPKRVSLLLQHAKGGEGISKLARPIGNWIYLPEKGFLPLLGDSLLHRDVVSKEEISPFLDQYSSIIESFLPVKREITPLRYHLKFDKKKNWHFHPYLLEKGDLQEKNAVLFSSWAYLPEKGFFHIDEPLFLEKKKVLPLSEVSSFVNQHKIWLGSQEGFITHLAGIETLLTYSLTPNQTFLFHPQVATQGEEGLDFGDWIYYPNQGFFSKKTVRVEAIVRPGLEVRFSDISRFIKGNREELEGISRFFSSRLPLSERGLHIEISSPSTLRIKPVYRGDEGLLFFGDFVYKEGEGFCELPASMRLPHGYDTERTISQERMKNFFLHDLPALKRYALFLDPQLQTPHRADLEIDYLVRLPSGKLKLRLFVQTELGKIPLTEICKAREKKLRFLFSEGGLLDLSEDLFQWVDKLAPVSYDDHTIELSTLEYFRLDASFGFLSPPETTPFSVITRSLIQELREFKSPEAPNPKGLKSELRLYQQTGLHWLWFLYQNRLSGLLCDDMGLGKTHQSMALMASILAKTDLSSVRFLVVCPTSVIYHWEEKLKVFLPSVTVQTFHGLKRSLKNLPKNGVLLTTYGVARIEKDNLAKISFELAIFDEVQVAKNAQSRIHASLLPIKARMRIGLTGTPIENNLKELKALFDVVLPGYMPGVTAFRRLFLNPIEREFDEEKKALLRGLIRPFILRRRKTEVLQELPEKSVDKSYCDLSETQIALYRKALAERQDALISELRDTEAAVSYIHVFALLSKLKQICNHPALIAKDPKNYKKYPSGKWDLFVELLQEARASDQKVVIFSQYLYMLDIIENHLKEHGWEYSQIRGDTVNRKEELKRFQEDPNCFFFIGSLQAAGLGIDLTAASVVILYDRWWNAARENQAIDRVHRIGQKCGVQVYKLITKGTIEEKIDRMITRKGKLMEEIVTADDQALLKKFTRSELIDLLQF